MRTWPFLLLLFGCDGVFNLDHVREPAGGDDARMRDASTLDVGLVAHLAFDGDLRDSVTGQLATCDTGACPTFEASHGMSAHFDGMDDCVADVPRAAGTIYTLAIWINTPTDSADTFFAEPWQGSNNTWRLETNANRTVRLATVDLNSNAYLTTPPDAYAVGVWTHVAATYDGSMRRIYVGGVLAAMAGPVQPEVETMPTIYVGCDFDASTTAHFGGYVDDARVYSRVLTDAEIGALANM